MLVLYFWPALYNENHYGKDILETSTQGFGRADAYLYQNGKKESVILFLFDHVLIICRKDRRNTLIYIGRADLDHAKIEDLSDGKNIHLDEENLVNIFFSWRLHDYIENKIYLFSHRTPLDKIQMMDALEYERAYVKENSLKTPFYTRLSTLKTQQYLTNQSKSFPSITKQHRSISTIFRTSSNQSSLLTTAIYHTPSRRRKSSLPRFVRCSSPDSSVEESFRSIKSRLRFWS
ncbi:unnamed protein product [Rotaria sp. Silwood1]|nr:unnamed protein product [Rotaria sp. Silwood1]